MLSRPSQIVVLYLTTAEQARAKGYTGVKQVFASATGSSEVTGEKFSFQANGKVLDGSGKSVNIGESGFITEGGNRINKAMSGVEQTAVGLQNGGDAITAVGLLTGQPEIAAVGGVLSNIGLGVEVVNNFATEGFNQETITKNGIKVGVNLAFGKLGDLGVSATRTVAGKAAVEPGVYIVSESIIQGTTAVGGKVAESMSQEMMKKKDNK